MSVTETRLSTGAIRVADAPPAPPRRRRLRRLVLRLVQREPVDNLLDWARFRVDTFPRRLRVLRLLGLHELHTATMYQELEWVGVRASRRAASTSSRWDAMLPLVLETGVRSAVDVGANVGWFAFAFDRLGIPCVAVERQERNVRIGLYARRRAGATRASFLVMDTQPDSIGLLPHADCYVFLAVWHHLVHESGLEAATDVLAALWERTGKVLFFETGEREMPASWGLPAMEPDPATWLAGYLAETCAGARVVHLGSHDAGLSSNGRRFERSLFAVVRDDA